MLRSLTRNRVVRLALVLAGFVVLAGLGSASAVAKAPSCADQVIADWYDDGRISKIYPTSCYRAAIAKLPPDVLDYSNAKEEIGRALAYAKQGKPDPGSQTPVETTPTTTSSSTTQTTTAGTTTTTTIKTTKTTKTTQATTQAESTQTEAAGDPSTDTSGPSSVPVPLLVLGGLAVLLLAAGSAGYLRRRMGNDGDDGTPPASA